MKPFPNPDVLTRVLADARAAQSAIEGDEDGAQDVLSRHETPARRLSGSANTTRRRDLPDAIQDDVGVGKHPHRPYRRGYHHRTREERRAVALKVRALMKEGLTFKQACVSVSKVVGVECMTVIRWCNANNVHGAGVIRFNGPYGARRAAWQAKVRAKAEKQRKEREEADAWSAERVFGGLTFGAAGMDRWPG